MSEDYLKSGFTKQSVLEIGTRLKKPPSDTLVQTAFSDEINQQGPLFEAIGLIDIAHTLVAIECGTIPRVPGRALLTHLLALQENPEAIVLAPSLGDLYTNREAWLTERTEAAGWLGAGRARREATTSALIVVLRSKIVHLIDTLAELIAAILDKAQQHSLSVMPDYTYLQAAQPTTFGHYLLGFAFPLLRDQDRLNALFDRLNQSPMGCGSTNGSRLRQDRRLLADFLGFNGFIPHARDAMWQADLFIEASSVLTACSINLSRLAEDLLVYATQEFALVELDDRHARASKIMPQKKNPFALTHIRGIANKIIGFTASVCASVRTPTGQPDNRSFIYGELPNALDTVCNAVSLMTEVLEDLTFIPERGKALLHSSWTLSTDLAETLVLECGLEFRKAHRLVAYLASEYPGVGLQSLDSGTIIQAAEKLFGHSLSLSEARLRKALDVDSAIQARSEPGGTSDASMNHMLTECRQQLANYRRNNQSRKDRLRLKERSLLERAANEVSQP